MKKLLFTAYNLDMGGIEKALVNLLNNIDYSKYKVTLILQKKEGIFLDEIPKEVEVLEYGLSNNKNVFIRKIYNRLNLLKWLFKVNNKYDFAGNFATYLEFGSKLVLKASSNSALWVHNNYTHSKMNDEEIKVFFSKIKINSFKNVIFVSNEARLDQEKFISKSVNKISINNIIDYNKINKLQNEFKVTKEKEVTFINVSRHDEEQKKISRLIKASKRLIEEGYEFKLWLVGDGINHKEYVDSIKLNKLDNIVKTIGSVSNPFPYYKASDVVVLASEYEGYPVVFIEAMLMKKPIITTKVSDYETIQGIVVEKSTTGVYEGMKSYLDKKFNDEIKFDVNKFNENIKDSLEELFSSK